MTMRRFILIFLAIGLCALALAAAGHWWLRWPGGVVGMWLGIGSGYLLAAAGMRLMPRWWRDHCDEAYAQPVHRQYVRALWPILIAYSLLLSVSIWWLKAGIEPVALRALVALLPVFPMLLLMRVFIRYLRQVDEFQRQIELEAIGVAALLVAMLTMAAGFLQLAKVIDLPAGVALIWVFPLIALGYGIGKFRATARYR